MLEQDYIMRAIHQLAAVLARILAAKKSERWDDAFTEIDNGLTALTGLTAAQLVNVPLAAVLAMLREQGDLGGAWGGAVSHLLMEHAAVLDAAERGDARVFRVLAFCLLDELSEAGALPPEHEGSLRWLVEHLD